MRLSFSLGEIEKAKEGGAGKYLPYEGEFTVRIASIEIKTKQDGNQMLEIMAEGIGKWEGKSGREGIGLDNNQISIDKRLWFVKALGFTEQEAMDGVDTADMVGKTVILKRRDPVLAKGKNGKDYHNWKTNWYPMPAEEVPQFESPADVDLPPESQQAPF